MTLFLEQKICSLITHRCHQPTKHKPHWTATHPLSRQKLIPHPGVLNLPPFHIRVLTLFFIQFCKVVASILPFCLAFTSAILFPLHNVLACLLLLSKLQFAMCTGTIVICTICWIRNTLFVMKPHSITEPKPTASNFIPPLLSANYDPAFHLRLNT